MNRAEGVPAPGNFQPCMSTLFDLFSTPSVEISTQNCYSVQINPSVPLSPGQDCIDFVIGQSTDFTHLSATNMYLEIFLTKADGTPLPQFDATHSVGLEQCPSSSIFRNIDCKLNNVQVSDNLGTYPYTAYLTQVSTTSTYVYIND